MQISSSTNKNCVGHAISIMRLALGYKTPLPSWYKVGSKTASDLPDLFADCFPHNEIDVWAWYDTEKTRSKRERLTYMGDVCEEKQMSEYAIMAFAYTTDKDKGHLVVGWPSPLGLGAKIYFIVGVR